MSEQSMERSTEFLKISDQFKLGALVTESSHPVTANLSEVAKTDVAAALGLLFQADGDVVNKFREFTRSGRATGIATTIVKAIRNGGRIFFTGCGSTGRLSIFLDSVWRDFWQQQNKLEKQKAESRDNFENRTFSVMAGGDFALIKSVEGFEDFTAFGKKQINDLGVSAKDVVFAITEGGETSFVIGTAWAGVEAGAKVYFVYNNPDDILDAHVERSREVIQEPRIEKINLTSGPMAITGSTRMQATSIQLCVMLTVLEMAVRELLGKDAAEVPQKFLVGLDQLEANLGNQDFLESLAKIVVMEESVYRQNRRNHYFAEALAIDILTDTTERSPTYCTPPFRKHDDRTAAESWAFLFLPQADSHEAWRFILKRDARCVEWTEAEVRTLVTPEKFPRTLEIVRKISAPELMRFKIGLDGINSRSLRAGDSAIGILSSKESGQFQLSQLNAARAAGLTSGLICFGDSEPATVAGEPNRAFLKIPQNDFLLDGLARAAAKLVLNALSTCIMVRLGRVLGNYMIWVVPSNLKLIDRATRYITKLTGLDYPAANALLFEIIEYVEPRMKADQAYPPVVGMAVLRAKEKLSNEQAEERLKQGI